MNNQVWIMSSAYPALSLEQVVEKAVETGCQGVEVCVFRRHGTRNDHIATHLDYDRFGPAQAEACRALFNRHKLGLSLGSYENCIGGAEESRRANQDHLLKVMRMAALLGGDANDVKVGTFVGYNHELGKEEGGFQRNLEEYERVFTPIIRYAEELGLTLLYENCPMEGWRPAGSPTTYNNLPATLASRKLMYALIPSMSHGETYDPSHDVWQHVDPAAVVRATDPARLQRVHVKGTRNLDSPARLYWGGLYPMQKVDARLAARAGVPTCANDWDRHHYEPMLPGFGGSDSLDWRAFTEAVMGLGFDQPFIIENEAANSKGTGNLAAIDQGFKAALYCLMPLLWKLGPKGYAYDQAGWRELKAGPGRDIPIRSMADLK